MSLTSQVKRVLPAGVLRIYSTIRSLQPMDKRTCPVCEKTDFFTTYGKPPRPEAQCKHCGALERHRLFWLWFKQNNFSLQGPVLHFAPEAIFESKFRRLFDEYKTADLYAPADLALNIERTDLPGNSVGTVICNHVLEHVDDKRALAELFRILVPGGLLIASTPIVEGWETTYENQNVRDDHGRALHFGQRDHVRFYGRDFRDRIRAAGFRLTEYTASPADVVSYGLTRGEKVFFARKP